MPPKQRITREMILERAFDIFCCEGMDAVNARSVAKALNCSTQPIFSYFTGMPDLRDALDKKAQDMFAEQVLSIAQGETWLVDVFAAYVRFAHDLPHVFGHLYERVRGNHGRMAVYAQMQRALIEHIAAREGVEGEKAAAICQETMTYVCGLAALSVVGSIQEGEVREKIERAYRTFAANL